MNCPLPGVLQRAKPGNFLIDLNAIPKDDAKVSTWFATPHQGHSGQWACTDDRYMYASSHPVGGRFNGLMFVDTITPTIGTSNSLRIAAEGRVF